jgi:hypothetical protein
MRLVHYKINHYPVFGKPKSSDHNIEIGGFNELNSNEIQLIKKRIIRDWDEEDSIDEGNIIICNIMNIDMEPEKEHGLFHE